MVTVSVALFSALVSTRVARLLLSMHRLLRPKKTLCVVLSRWRDGHLKMSRFWSCTQPALHAATRRKPTGPARHSSGMATSSLEVSRGTSGTLPFLSSFSSSSFLIKPNSHSEITAFFASLSKVLSIMDSGLVPPNVNLKSKNPAIKWDEYRLKAVERITRLPKTSLPLIAMTSSGIGGANGHAVIEGPPPHRGISAAESFWRSSAKERADLLVLGGLSPRSTTSIAQDAQSLVGSSHLRDAALTYGRVSRSMTWRSWGIARQDQKTDFSEPVLASKTKRPIVFVFSGQGSQHFESEMSLLFTPLPLLKCSIQWVEASTERPASFKKL
jgi:hypothetical protein